LLSPSEHAGLHNLPQGQMLSCPICNTSFWARPSIQGRRRTNYCSLQCAALSKRVADRPDKSDLIALLSTVPNFIAAGNLYGVSDNAVRKWCKSYGLPTKTADWKMGV
jgi:hypothetical protein